MSKVKIIALVKRKEGMSFDEFDEYWRVHHGSFVVNHPIAQIAMDSYVQLHINKEGTEKMQKVAGPVRGRQDWDGMVEVTFKSLDEFFDWNKEPYFQNVVLKDEDKFIETLQLYVVQEEPQWKDGKTHGYAKIQPENLAKQPQ